MKYATRILTLLLALVLCAGLAVPVFAEEGEELDLAMPEIVMQSPEEDEPDPAMPVITMQPEPYTVQNNPSTFFRVGVLAEIPNGDPIGYQWYEAKPKGDIPLSSTTNRLNEGYSEWDLLIGVNFYCVVYNQSDSTAEEGPHRVVSETVAVRPSSRVSYMLSNITARILGIALSPVWLTQLVFSLMGSSGAIVALILMSPYLLLLLPLMIVTFSLNGPWF